MKLRSYESGFAPAKVSTSFMTDVSTSGAKLVMEGH
jgi:hypothetical protein